MTKLKIKRIWSCAITMWNRLYQLGLHHLFLYICIFKQKLAQELVMSAVEYIPIKTAKSLNKNKKQTTTLKGSFTWEKETRNIEKMCKKHSIEELRDANCYIISFKQTLDSTKFIILLNCMPSNSCPHLFFSFSRVPSS